MYSQNELKAIKELIIRKIAQKKFELMMVETDLLFSINDIDINDEEYRAFETDITLREFKEEAKNKSRDIKKELEQLSFLYLKTNSLLDA